MYPITRILRPLTVIAVAASLAGCLANPVRQLGGSPSFDDVRIAFEETGRALIQHLRSLMSRASDNDALDFQTAITLESVRLSPRHVADRGIFYQEADHLDNLLSDMDESQVPRDSAVLAYLARLASGQREIQHHLTPWEEDRVLKLCGPAQMTPGSNPDSSDPDEILRQACFKWLLGDAPKSRALFYYMQAQHNTSQAHTPESAFDAFILRLREETGVDLMAHRVRLSGDTASGLTATLRQDKGTILTQEAPRHN